MPDDITSFEPEFRRLLEAHFKALAPDDSEESPLPSILHYKQCTSDDSEEPIMPSILPIGSRREVRTTLQAGIHHMGDDQCLTTQEPITVTEVQELRYRYPSTKESPQWMFVAYVLDEQQQIEFGFKGVEPKAQPSLQEWVRSQVKRDRGHIPTVTWTEPAPAKPLGLVDGIRRQSLPLPAPAPIELIAPSPQLSWWHMRWSMLWAFIRRTILRRRDRQLPEAKVVDR